MKRIILTLSFLITSLFSVPLVVTDPEQTTQNASIIGHLVESYNKYVEILEKAQAQVDQLNKANTIMGNVSSFLNSSAIAIANPLDVIENLKSTIELMKSNAERLKTSIKNFSLADKVHRKRLQSKCPWLQYDLISPRSLKIFFTETGEETQLVKDAKALINALSDDLYLNMQNTLGNLSGRALAENLCETVLKEDLKRQIEVQQLREKKALIDGDFSTYEALKQKRLKAEITQRMNQEVEIRQKYEPLIKRNTQMLEALGVKDKTANTSEFIYCKEGKNKDREFCYPQALEVDRLNNEFAKLQKELNEQLISAGNNTETQAQVYANFNQKSQNLLLSYTKEIAYNLSFLNETMSLMGSLMADDYRKKYSDPSLVLYDSSSETKATEQELKEKIYENKAFYQYSTTFDNNGFPILHFESSSEK